MRVRPIKMVMALLPRTLLPLITLLRFTSSQGLRVTLATISRLGNIRPTVCIVRGTNFRGPQSLAFVPLPRVLGTRGNRVTVLTFSFAIIRNLLSSVLREQWKYFGTEGILRCRLTFLTINTGQTRLVMASIALCITCCKVFA